MNVVVIGLGSMGKRRIRLLKRYGNIQKIYGVDKREDRRHEITVAMDIPTFANLNEVLEKCDHIDCAFVSTSPLSHSSIIRDCLEKKLHVFTEINLVNDGYEENIKLAEEKGRVLFLSSTFLYREEIASIKNEVAEQHKPINYIYHVGQYLPDWHPWENYNGFFVGERRTNGCREIMAIELPWLIDTFGDIKFISAIHDRIGTLDICYDDNYMIQIQHMNGNKGVLVVDVVSPRAVRNLNIYSEDIYLIWDGTPYGLQKYNRDEKNMRNIQPCQQAEHNDKYQATIVENAYANEMEDFFQVIIGKKKQRYGFQKDYQILKWIDQIEGMS